MGAFERGGLAGGDLGGAGGGGVGAGGGAAGLDGAADGDDGLPRAGHAAVLVLCAGGVVGDFNVFDVHGEGAGAVVGGAAGPGDRAGVVGGVAAGPGADLDLHGGLRVLVAALGGGQDAHRLAVDHPDNLLGGPVDGVGVEGGLGSRDGVGLRAVVAACDALAKVVGLDMGSVAANKFQVDLVQVVGLHDHRADDARSRGSLHGDLDFAEHDVPVGFDGGRIAGLLDGERRSVRAVVAYGLRRRGEPAGLALGKVGGERFAKSRIRWAGLLQRVALGVGLASGEAGKQQGC